MTDKRRRKADAADACRRRAFGTIGVAAALQAALSGCVSVLPKSPPVQLYTFGQQAPPAMSPVMVSPAPALAVVLSAVTLPGAATGDQILTLQGQRAAYVAGARWLTPAGSMFQAAAERALRSQTRRVRLLARSDYGAAQALLRLDVEDFEARYEGTPGAAPTILVSLHASFSRSSGQPLAAAAFTVREPAAENRVSAIVAAYDRATSQVLDRVCAWTDVQAAATPPQSGAPTAAIDHR